METIILPDDLHLNSAHSIEVFNYESLQEISKQQIVLNKNTISFLREGSKEVFFDNSSFSITGSEFLLMKSGHCLMTEKLSKTKSNYHSVLLFFSDESILGFIKKYQISISKSNHCNSVHSFTYDDFIHRFVISLLDIIKLSIQSQKHLLTTKFEEILLYLIARYGPNFLNSFLKNNDNQTQRFIQTIESNRLNKLTLSELAFLCNMSISSFKREFKKQFDISPVKWFQEKRLEHAHNQLKEKNKRPSDIYLEAGYENLSSFIQAYKSKYGVTPKQHQQS